MSDFLQRAEELVEAGRYLYGRNMVPATSGNFSARLSDGTFAVTVSGRHKGRLTVADIMRIDADGHSLDERRPSAETGLHTQIYARFPQARVVLHPHSVNATVLSLMSSDSLLLRDYELLKAFPDVATHDCSVRIPVFGNDQDIARLAANVDAHLAERCDAPGYLIRGHGFYTWGDSIGDAMRHVEAFEFLFSCELRLRGK
ncbi:MAG: methylthioribulose 1-phosphate dehydratase [Gammaproteobacteria bacterium]|nr:methylthioribulose 1-phosphate dehydratase [Gammaproteobacteria bacterium]MCP5318779.1 methylthioribulose 1-phosphate dehydratase [Chromatiaceae bacterium]MCW5587020.1 methylthioribulose 1-phosphate dehydratase [Chromatiales bacterium]MCB1816910.1 methylthioribulose 1-phosphate dehydratase [Gammaproteobacteria bacterium]MCP5429909.1 methylthioribulose 1-phosphate dehydratase [Chromatiaceae bacterium]